MQIEKNCRYCRKPCDVTTQLKCCGLNLHNKCAQIFKKCPKCAFPISLQDQLKCGGGDAGKKKQQRQQQQSSSNDLEAPTCPICLEKLPTRSNRHRHTSASKTSHGADGGKKIAELRTCKHIFCLECLLQWSKRKNQCPLDRIAYSKILEKEFCGGPILNEIDPPEPIPQSDDEEEMQDVVCEVCRSGNEPDTLLLCDRCDSAYHMICLPRPLHSVPEGEWFCPQCAFNASRNAANDSSEMDASLVEICARPIGSRIHFPLHVRVNLPVLPPEIEQQQQQQQNNNRREEQQSGGGSENQEIAGAAENDRNQNDITIFSPSHSTNNSISNIKSDDSIQFENEKEKESDCTLVEEDSETDATTRTNPKKRQLCRIVSSSSSSASSSASSDSGESESQSTNEQRASRSRARPNNNTLQSSLNARPRTKLRRLDLTDSENEDDDEKIPEILPSRPRRRTRNTQQLERQNRGAPPSRRCNQLRNRLNKLIDDDENNKDNDDECSSNSEKENEEEVKKPNERATEQELRRKSDRQNKLPTKKTVKKIESSESEEEETEEDSDDNDCKDDGNSARISSRTRRYVNRLDSQLSSKTKNESSTRPQRSRRNLIDEQKWIGLKSNLNRLQKIESSDENEVDNNGWINDYKDSGDDDNDEQDVANRSARKKSRSSDHTIHTLKNRYLPTRKSLLSLAATPEIGPSSSSSSSSRSVNRNAALEVIFREIKSIQLEKRLSKQNCQQLFQKICKDLQHSSLLIDASDSFSRDKLVKLTRAYFNNFQNARNIN